MKKWILTILGMVALQAAATSISQDTAVEATLRWMSGNPVMSKASRTVATVETFPTTGSYSVYVVRLEPKGFLILNSDERLPLTVSFSAESSVNLSDDPQNALRGMLLGYCEKKAEELENWTSPQSAMVAMNELYAEDERYGPFLETSWNQSDPYNLLCPAVSGGVSENDNRAPVGCVPTAYAQLLNYHRWPYFGTGSYSYTDRSGSLTGAHSADFSDAYDWGNMQAAHSSSDSQVRQDAVAELMYELGVAAGEDYEAGGTSGYPTVLGNRLGDYFFFEPIVTHSSSSALITPLMADLRAGFPCVVSYYDAVYGGHTFIADGLMIDSGATTYHLNMGWGGHNNGWYTKDTVPALHGDEPLESGITSLRPQLLAFPQTNAVSCEEGESVEMKWILPKRREDEVGQLEIKRYDESLETWETLAVDTMLASRRFSETPTVWDDCTSLSGFKMSSGSGWPNGITDWVVENGAFFKGSHPEEWVDEYHLTSDESIDVDASTRLKLRVKYTLASGSPADDVFRILVSTDRSSFTEVWVGYGSMDWGDITIDLSAYAGQSVYVRLQYEYDGYYMEGGGIWIDTVSTQVATNPELEDQPIHYTTLTNLPAGTHTLAAVLTDINAVEHALGPAFTLTVADSDDGDGIPSDWEIQFGLDPDIDDGELDSDGDGFSNWKEYICGTVPTNAASVWKLGMGSGSLPAFQGLDNRTYTIEYCDGLSSNDWKTLASGIEGSNGLFEVSSFESATNVCRYYRVNVQEAD